MDTSTAALTVALCRAGEPGDDLEVLAHDTLVDARRHTEALAPMVRSVMDEANVPLAQVSTVVCGVGPGPFTSLRVGMVSAATFGKAVGARVIGVFSLDAMAHQAVASGAVSEGEEFLVASDARRKEVYWARYRCIDAWPHRIGEPAVNRPADVARGELKVFGAGSAVYPDLLGPASEIQGVDARSIAAIAHETPRADAADGYVPCGVTDFNPAYLRRPDAEEPGTAKSVLSGS